MMFLNKTQSMTSVSGSVVTVYPQHSYGSDFGARMHNGILTTNTAGVHFGTGTTPPNKADYKLEEEITSGLSITNQESAEITDLGGGKYKVEASFILKNTTAEAIAISEIGLYSYGGYSSSSAYTVLFERQVFDTPITIQPNESKLVTYKLTFNQSQ